MNYFNSEETLKAFLEWQKLWAEPTYHPCDMDRFHAFVKVYHEQKEDITKEQFSRMCKEYTKTSRHHHYGAHQKFYRRLTAIVEYLKWQDRKQTT